MCVGFCIRPGQERCICSFHPKKGFIFSFHPPPPKREYLLVFVNQEGFFLVFTPAKERLFFLFTRTESFLVFTPRTNSFIVFNPRTDSFLVFIPRRIFFLFSPPEAIFFLVFIPSLEWYEPRESIWIELKVYWALIIL